MASQQGRGAWQPDFLTDIRPPANFPYRRLAKWATVVAGIIFIIVLLNMAKNVYTEWLWFDALGYRAIYSKAIVTRLWLFFAGALLFIAIFLGNIRLAQHLAKRDEPAILPFETILLIQSLTRISIIVLTLILALVFGAVASAQWENFLRFTSATPFVNFEGQPIADPLNGHNPAFYVFSLPFVRFIQTWLLGIVLMLILSAVAIYAVGLSLRGFQLTFARGVKVHVSVLVAILALIVAWSYWFDAKDLVLSSRGLRGTLFGANFTDANAKLFALRFMMGVTTAVGVMAVVSAFTRGVRLPVIAFGIWVASVIIVLAIYPNLYHRFRVQPSELAKELPFIERNIEMTREAFGLNRIEVSHFPTEGQLSSSDLLDNAATVDNIRLWDHRPLKDTYNQIQFLRPYYTFVDVDVDRYEIDGSRRQVMLAAREIAPENLPDEAQSWVARRLQYTHGYGLAMSPVTEFTSEGRPNFFVQDIPPRGAIPIDRPEVYYGENSEQYVLVNTKTQEFDYPTEQDIPVFTTYEGTGGVRLSSLLRRAAFAWRTTDFNLLISNEITSDSSILFIRDVRDRVRHIAPFLTLDDDPYLVAAEGRLFWIQDAYTTTQRFPYSQPYRQGYNYIRNSVKAVVDAYNGTVDFYIFEPEDAVLRTYARIFPDLFQPRSAMPPEIAEHIRYPEDLFNIQEELFRTYHVTDPRVFFAKEDLWSRPFEIFYDEPQTMEAYYVIMRLPGEAQEEFLLMLPFTPLNKPNLVAWLAARSDGENYGKLVAFTFPKDKQVDGPTQVEARINTDPLISQQFTLWGQQGSQIIRGNLLVIPLASSILYVEPIYLQADTLNFPELKRVVVAFGADSPVMAPSLSRSLEVALGRAPPTPLVGLPLPPDQQPDGQQQPEPGNDATPAPTPISLDELIETVEELLEQLQQLQEQQGR